MNKDQAVPEPVVELKNVTKIFEAGRATQAVTAVDDMNLQIKEGEFFTFLGPSGCGKTTTLRLIAGFEKPTEGDIFIEGRPMNDVPPNRRPVNTVFQNYALFPHLTVAQNVGFALAVQRVSRDERRERVREALELVRLPGMEARKPSQLSGGQQQRVALARALINEPAVLLLDEPLGALDLKLRKEVQVELKQLQTRVGITFIYVTHDQEEALTMSDRIAVMRGGLVQQVGTPQAIYEHPQNRFVADFIGETNFLLSTVEAIGKFVGVRLGPHTMSGTANGRELAIDQEVTLAIRPEKISLYPQGNADVLKSELGVDDDELAKIFGGNLPRSTMDVRDYLSIEKDNVVVEGHVENVNYIGTDIRYRVALTDNATVVVRVQNYGTRYDTRFAVGDPVFLHWPAENAQILTD